MLLQAALLENYSQHCDESIAGKTTTAGARPRLPVYTDSPLAANLRGDQIRHIAALRTIRQTLPVTLTTDARALHGKNAMNIAQMRNPSAAHSFVGEDFDAVTILPTMERTIPVYLFHRTFDLQIVDLQIARLMVTRHYDKLVTGM